MRVWSRFLVVLGSFVAIVWFPAEAQTIVALGGGLNNANGLAVDSDGNIFIADTGNNAVKKILAADGFATLETISKSGLSGPIGVAVDASGNVFVADTGNNAVKEILATGGYVTVNTLGSGFAGPRGVAVDANGNVFVADFGNNALKEILAAGGYATVKTLDGNLLEAQAVTLDANGNVFAAGVGGAEEILAAGGYATINYFSSASLRFATGIAVDANDNVFVTNTDPAVVDGDAVQEFLAANAYATVQTIGNGFHTPQGIAVDAKGDVFVNDGISTAVAEILPTAPVLGASVLPGSRSVQLGATATIFATMINSGATALDNCQVALPSTPFTLPGVSLTYQATDPTTNQPIGSPDTPVTIPGGNGMQSFLLSFGTQSDTAFDEAGAPLVFSCSAGNVTNVAPIITGVDTVDFSGSSTPTADVVALAATPTNNGIVDVPNNGAAAFAVATINLGATATLNASVDTGAATLPVSATLCPTDPSTGECLLPPGSLVTLDIDAGATPTFSVFLQSSGAIPLDPATSRVFVRFEDSGGGLHGSTSVAIETN
jgi:sugar lactone lactonase YvrE